MLFISEVEDQQWCEDDSSWNGSDEKLDPSSDLNREWQKRKNQFHAVSYPQFIQKKIIITYNFIFLPKS